LVSGEEAGRRTVEKDAIWDLKAGRQEGKEDRRGKVKKEEKGRKEDEEEEEAVKSERDRLRTERSMDRKQ
jgi:hypothetical protein